MLNKKEIDDVPIYKEYEIQNPFKVKNDVDEKLVPPLMPASFGLLEKDDKKDKAPVDSNYSYVRFNWYILFDEIDKRFSAYMALKEINRLNSKEGRDYHSQLVSLFTSVFNRVSDSQEDIKAKMISYEKKMFELLYPDKVYDKNNNIVFRFTSFMYRNLYDKKYKVQYDDLVESMTFVRMFIQLGGFYDIAGKFQDDDKTDEYMRESYG